MNQQEQFWYRTLFRLKLLEASGEAFQRLVGEVLEAEDPRFRRVAPWGRAGDSGNDGFIKEEGHYFQIYGPERPEYDPVAAARKAAQDFAKLSHSYAPARYTFVLNDRFRGIPEPVYRSLREIESNFGVDSAALGARDLTERFMRLPEEKRQDILCGIPGDVPGWVDPSAVGEVLRCIADRAVAGIRPAKNLAPEFEEKIRFNGLRGYPADRLRAMSYQAHQVDAFLSTREPHLAQCVAEEMRTLYGESRRITVDELDGADWGNDPPDPAAMQYLWLVEQLVPDHARGHLHSLKAYREAAEVVLSKYFESCDVFEEPGAGNRAP
jgi:hypothetical protein